MSDGKDPYLVRGGMAASQIRYVNIEGSGIHLWIRAAEVNASRSSLDQAVARHQRILSPKARTNLIDRMSAIQDYPPVNLAEHGGWVGASNYYFRNGEHVGSAGAPPAEIAFAPVARGVSCRGTHHRWRRYVAKPLVGQPLIQFLVQLAFAGPVLSLTDRSLNLMFEVVGTGGEGKSSALAIAASTAGPAIDRGLGTYQFRPSGTVNWLEEQMLAHADATAFIDSFEVFAAGESPAVRAKMVHDFLFRHFEGQTRGRFEGQTVTYRGAGAITGNQGVADVLTSRYATILNPATSRLISLAGDAGQGLGTLDHLPEGFATPREFITSILRATEEEHGTALPELITQLVQVRSEDEAALRSQITERIEGFLQQTNAAAGGMPGRVAEAFAIVGVAGALAKRFRILPDEWEPMNAAMTCYQRYLASQQMAEARPVVDILRSYLAQPEIVDLDAGLPELTDEAFALVPGFRRTTPTGVQLWVPPDAINRLFPDWTRRQDSADILAYLDRDGRHYGKKRRVRRGADKIRTFVFHNFQ